MSFLRSLYFSVVACLLLGSGQVVSADTISVGGAVLKPGSYQWHADARLRDAAVAGQVRASAWPPGAALLRMSALEPQQRLKAGVLFDLRVNRLHARAEGNAALLALAERLDAQVAAMPVTGRVTAELDPFQLLLAHKNQLMEPGDTLLYPTRPAQVRVMGAVTADCELAFDAALALKDYLRQCPAHAAADRSMVYVIQPNGEIEEVGIAHWNEQQVNLAVGAVLYRAISTGMLSSDTPDLNKDMAALLATQYELGGHFGE